MANEIKFITITAQDLTALVYYDNAGTITARTGGAISLTEFPVGSGMYSANGPSGMSAGDFVVIKNGAGLVVGGGEYLPAVTEVAGAGAFLHTLTIRNTSGTPLGVGIKVWINTSNIKSGSVIKPVYTNSNGQVSVWLDYGTYYVFCESSAYSFLEDSSSNDFISSAGSVAFNFDIGTAITIVSDGDASFISRMIISIQRYIDEPATKAKYTDDVILQEVEKAYPIILEEINRNKQDDIIVARYTITTVAGVDTYVLPTTISSVVAIYVQDATTGFKSFFYSRGRRNEAGRGIWLEGNMLKIQTVGADIAGRELIIEYIPSATARLHNGICTLNAAGDEAVLAGTPSQGTLDTHANAYAGSVIRILSANSNGNLQERIITEYDHLTRTAVLAVAFDPIPSGTIYYEICPPILRGLDDLVASYVAWQVALIEGQRNRASDLMKSYMNRIRTVRLNAFYYNQTTTPTMRVDGSNNSRRNMRRLP
jgi:hypothetical protein